MSQSRPEDRIIRDSLYQRISPKELYQVYSFSYTRGHSSISWTLGNNAQVLEQMNQFLRSIASHPTLTVKRIRLTGYSSIDGTYRTNDNLSRNRVQILYKYLRDTYPDLYDFPHDLAWITEDWNYLSRLVRQSEISEREEILQIIHKVPEFDRREQLISYLNGGNAYAVLERQVLPELRRVEIEIECGNRSEIAAAPPAPEETGEKPDWKVWDKAAINDWLGLDDTKTHENDTYKKNYPLAIPSTLSPGPSMSRVEAGLRRGIRRRQGGYSDRLYEPARLVFRTNLLLNAGISPELKQTAPVLNGEVEYAFTPLFSINLGAMYSYWSYNGGENFQGLSGYMFEPRFNFHTPSNRVTMFVGPYGRFGDYDLRYAPEDNKTGKYWDTGLSAGVRFHLFGPVGFEIGMRAGHVGSKMYTYTRVDGKSWYAGEVKYGKTRVTNFNLSLTYSIGN